MSYTTQLGLTDWELEQAKLDELYSYDKDEPWWQRWGSINDLTSKTMKLIKTNYVIVVTSGFVPFFYPISINSIQQALRHCEDCELDVCVMRVKFTRDAMAGFSRGHFHHMYNKWLDQHKYLKR